MHDVCVCVCVCVCVRARARIGISGVSCVCLPLRYRNWYSRSCFVTIVTDLLGDLRTWQGTDVIASDQDKQHQRELIGG